MQLPQTFIERSIPIFGNEMEQFLQALQEEPSTSIRVNDKRTVIAGLTRNPQIDVPDTGLQVELAMTEPVKWCETGFYLPERPLFTADPLFHAGAYYVQEASSMFVEQAIKQYINQPVNMLDLCAAPGGKSTHLSSLLPDGSLLVSNEINRSRAYILAENQIKWGNPNVVVTNNSPKDFEQLPAFFDSVLIDAPCSGEGMFRKDEGAIKEWSPENVRMCAERQREILLSVWDSLKTGGILIYSTCTYNREENEENVRWIIQELGAEFLPLKVEKEWGITESELGYRFYPHKTKGEGFFLSVMRKTSETQRQTRIKKEKKSTKIQQEVLSLKNNILKPDEWVLLQSNSHIQAFPTAKAEEMEFLEKKLKVLHIGITLAEQKGKDFIPDISLALSKYIDKSQFNTVEVDKKTAILFLQKETIELPSAAEKGYVLLTYQHLPIGLVKNIGNRSNNLYPQEWRIRMKNLHFQ
jgi:16S rRNA C967 or C1407 C5-methylase (RsmB/RsmF family)/NOL1/NOP2/fmu family ribosome biogenesis protein